MKHDACERELLALFGAEFRAFLPDLGIETFGEESCPFLRADAREGAPQLVIACFVDRKAQILTERSVEHVHVLRHD